MYVYIYIYIININPNTPHPWTSLNCIHCRCCTCGARRVFLVLRTTSRGTCESRSMAGFLGEDVGFVWKCWDNIPNEIAIFHRDNDHENHWVQWGLAYFQTNPVRKKWKCWANNPKTHGSSWFIMVHHGSSWFIVILTVTTGQKFWLCPIFWTLDEVGTVDHPGRPVS